MLRQAGSAPLAGPLARAAARQAKHTVVAYISRHQSFRSAAPQKQYSSHQTRARRPATRRQLQVKARAEDLPVKDRVLGALPYLIPLLDGIRYGRYFFFQFPIAAQILSPVRPLLNLYYGIPFASLVIFFGLYGGVANNMNFSRHVRFNAMQALLLSIILIFPSLVEQVFRGSLGGTVQINLYNTIWLFTAACVAYGSGSSLLGTVARLPLVGSAADQRVP